MSMASYLIAMVVAAIVIDLLVYVGKKINSL